MPLPDLNDPAMHTTFIIDPHDIFVRYTDVFTPTARLREGARVAFLVPGRISYLLFGAFAGFVVFRYVLALVAVVPTYVLLRRLYGRVAGAVGVIAILSSPVIITAWGTDFPDSAAVSYLAGGLACLAMPSMRHRTAWLAGAGALMTMAVWSFASSAPLVIVTVGIYGLVCFRRDRSRLVRDLTVMAGGFVAVTGVLAVASGWLLGRVDYLVPTIQSLIYLAHPSQVVLWHSASWRWAPYDAYLLVPPATLAAWFIGFGRRVGAIPTPQLIVGAACAGQLVVSVLGQFVGGVQLLEMHYFSSLLWAAVSLTFALTLVELGRRLLLDPRFAWLLPLIVIAVPLGYELDPHVPAFGWLPAGAGIVALTIATALVARRWRSLGSMPARLGSAAALAVLPACVLILTVAPVPPHAALARTVYDPPPAYSTALGGGASPAVDLYRATTQIPAFVGPATYSGEQLLMWWPPEQVQRLLEPIGIYHAFFDSIPGGFGTLSVSGRHMIELRRPAQILLLSFTGQQFRQSLQSLGDFQAALVRTGVLHSGSVSLHVWLIELERYSAAGRT